MAIAELLDLLACPHCGGPFELTPDGRSVRCARGHSFDLARQGYLNLHDSPAPRNADTAGMIAARSRFLLQGHYGPVTARLVAMTTGLLGPAARLLDVGAGPGHYLSQLLNHAPSARGVALDVSVAAARRAATAHRRAGAVVADVWQQIPVGDGRVDLVLNVFAPRNADEFRRVLAPNGILITVTPEPAHLAEVRKALGLLEIQPAKHDQLRSGLAGGFDERASETVTFEARLDSAALHDLVAMGPSAFHLSEQEISRRVSALAAPVTVTVSVDISLWQPKAR